MLPIFKHLIPSIDCCKIEINSASRPPTHMKTYIFSLLFIMFFLFSNAQSPALRIIMIGAHPDDCDQDGGGTAILFANMGYAVKFVSVTNGDAGHQSIGGGMLAKRRILEAKEAGKRFGVEYEVLDNHDGELLPTLNVDCRSFARSGNGMQISLLLLDPMIIILITGIPVFLCRMLRIWWPFQT